MSDDLANLMDAAQRAAGVLNARHRGDHHDAAMLMSSFESSDELAGGSLLLAQLTLGLYAEASGQSFEVATRELSVQLEAAVGGS